MFQSDPVSVFIILQWLCYINVAHEHRMIARLCCSSRVTISECHHLTLDPLILQLIIAWMYDKLVVQHHLVKMENSLCNSAVRIEITNLTLCCFVVVGAAVLQLLSKKKVKIYLMG